MTWVWRIAETDLELECWLVESLDSGAVGAGVVLILWTDMLAVDWVDNVVILLYSSVLLDMAKRGTNIMEAWAYGCT